MARQWFKKKDGILVSEDDGSVRYLTVWETLRFYLLGWRP